MGTPPAPPRKYQVVLLAASVPAIPPCHAKKNKLEPVYAAECLSQFAVREMTYPMKPYAESVDPKHARKAAGSRRRRLAGFGGFESLRAAF